MSLLRTLHESCPDKVNCPAIRVSSTGDLFVQGYRITDSALLTELKAVPALRVRWGYAYNVRAGEDIRILDLAETPEPPGLVDHDFWLVDEDRVVRMHYDDARRFLGGEALPETETPRYVAARDATWAAATPFEPWWAARPQYHRGARLAG
jgi:hypothetical protein